MLRKRPPLSTREIAAYQAGIRLCQFWLSYKRKPAPTRDWVLQHFAIEDGQVMYSLGARKWWRWFGNGWDDWAGDRPWL
jgi:hypothetical protein